MGSGDIQIKQEEHAWADESSALRSLQEPYHLDAPASVEHLDFQPQPMVGWYKPPELLIAAFRTVVSSIFGTYADKREIESVLAEPVLQDYSEHFERHGEIWIDYVADTGDGWSSTYTIARLLAEEELAFDKDGKGRVEPAGDCTITKRGRILIMGGDQVYPVANLEEYRNRLIGPYRCALPFVPDSEQAPHLFAIPGNHDWYDGLSSFFHLFCHQKWLGGWKMQQTRSYFAFKIDERLWVWGIDIQLCANIDQPQLDYFDRIASEMPEGSKIILCVAEPSWAYVEMKTWQERNAARREVQKEREFKNLGYLEDKIVHRYGHDVVVALAGDAHNYARYASAAAGHQRFVAGGGGAHLFPTHGMPPTLEIPQKYGGEVYRRHSVYPDDEKSRKLANLSILFPFFRLNWGFSLFMGTFYLLLAWVMQSVSKISARAENDTLLDKLSSSLDVTAFVKVLVHSPGSVAFMVVLLSGLIAFSGFKSTPKRVLHGTLHTLAHLLLFLGLMYAIAQIHLGIVGWHVDHWRQVLLFGVEMLFLGGFLGGLIFGVYLWFSNRFLGLHDSDVLLCQSSPDYKNFLRFHVRKDGTITIFPVGVANVERRRSWSMDPIKRCLAGWTLRPDATGGAAWFEPDDGPIQARAELIEPPVPVSFKTSSPE